MSKSESELRQAAVQALSGGPAAAAPAPAASGLAGAPGISPSPGLSLKPTPPAAGGTPDFSHLWAPGVSQ